MYRSQQHTLKWQPPLFDLIIMHRRRKPFTALDIMKKYHSARGFLLDTFSRDAYGGTGQTFDWSQIPSDLAGKIILAGGLTVENVATAIAQVKPYGVDVISGIEASKGKKDPVKMQAFVNAINKASNA